MPDLPLEELTNDQLLSSYLLESGVTSVRIPVRKTIEDFLIYYSRNKEALDEQFNRSMDFTYSVIDAFEDSGQKIPDIIAHNAIFIDCAYLHKDLYSILFDLSQLLKEQNYGLFVIARKRLNQMLVYARDDLNVCNYVPEVDIVVKDQVSVYSLPYEEAETLLKELQFKLYNVLGVHNTNQFTMNLPTLNYLKQNEPFSEMMKSTNANLIINMVLLSIIVIYSLMLSDVNGQTYQFAMMRALGFHQSHVFVFVVLQALSFAFPGIIIGLMFSFILNVGFSEAIYITVRNAGDYDIPTSALAIGVFVFGFIVPILSIIGPTKDALSKNLRGSLDASRRNGDNESVSQVVKKLEDLALSRREVLFSVLLIVFGIFTYYFLPYSVLF